VQVEVSSPGEREPESALCTSQSTPTNGEEGEKVLQNPETTQSTAVTDQSKTNDINNRSTNETGKDYFPFVTTFFSYLTSSVTILTSHIAIFFIILSALTISNK
jgi:hypothetical protein